MTGRILHVSDIHFGCENKAAVDAVLQIARTEPFDLIAITGDITQFGTPDEFAAASAFVAALPPQRLLTPGNHDVPYATPERLYAPFNRYRKIFGDPWTSSFEGPGLSARAFNSSRGAPIRRTGTAPCSCGSSHGSPRWPRQLPERGRRRPTPARPDRWPVR